MEVEKTQRISRVEALTFDLVSDYLSLTGKHVNGVGELDLSTLSRWCLFDEGEDLRGKDIASHNPELLGARLGVVFLPSA